MGEEKLDKEAFAYHHLWGDQRRSPHHDVK